MENITSGAERLERDTSRSKLIKAAEALLRESGYAAVTSRKVAAKAGLKPQLVHYHFRSMDELFLEVYREWAASQIARLESIAESEYPLRGMWELTLDARGALLNEFIALANHRKDIQQEIAEFGNRYRQTQIGIMDKILKHKGNDGFPWSPGFAAILLNALARSLASESEVGITEGHGETLAIVERFMDQFDGPDNLKDSP